MSQMMMLVEHAPDIFGSVPTGRKRDLGGAVVLAAIEDYRSLNHQAHQDAAKFLFPRTPERQEHFAWVVAMSDHMNVPWLREALDGLRAQWDGERLRKQAVRRRLQ